MIRLPRASSRPKASLRSLQSAYTSRRISTKGPSDLKDGAESPPNNSSDQPDELPKRAFYERKSANPPLPLSSFLDPFRIEQRHRHRNRTPKPEAPVYQDLSPIRQKLARNVYAKLLAQPIRPCTVTGASLPQSMLLKFNQLPDPAPPHTKTLVPLALYNESVKDAPRVLKNRGEGQSIGVNRRFVQWLVDYYKTQGTLHGALLKHDGKPGKMAPNTVATIDKLFADVVMRTLAWPFKHGSKDFVSLSAGILNQNPGFEPSAVLFFGGSAHNRKILEMESKLEDIIQEIDGLLIRWKINIKRVDKHSPLSDMFQRANPRILHPPEALSTIEYTYSLANEEPTSEAENYSIPVIPMVDIMGHRAAKELLRGTKHEGSNFVAVRSSISTADQVARLITCAWWAKEGKLPIAEAPDQGQEVDISPGREHDQSAKLL
jgi:hypothetical protein